MPSKKQIFQKLSEDTILPEGIEKVPARFSISYRNKWMVDRADTVITYVKYPPSGAAKFKELAIKKEKRLLSLILLNKN